MEKFPQILIQYNEFLDKIFKCYLKNSSDTAGMKWRKWEPPTREYILEKTKIYQKEWMKYGDDILSALFEITGLKFERNKIDIFIVSGVLRSYSNPIIISGSLKIEPFIDILTHELIHLLILDNKIETRVHKYIDDIYPMQSKTTRSHILVFAIQTHIFIKVFNDKKRIITAMERSKKHGTKEYSVAWEIVNKFGYKNVIEGIKNKFKSK